MTNTIFMKMEKKTRYDSNDDHICFVCSKAKLLKTYELTVGWFFSHLYSEMNMTLIWRSTKNNKNEKPKLVLFSHRHIHFVRFFVGFFHQIMLTQPQFFIENVSFTFHQSFSFKRTKLLSFRPNSFRKLTNNDMKWMLSTFCCFLTRTWIINK